MFVVFFFHLFLQHIIIMTVLFQVLSEFPNQCSVECLYIVLSSAVFVRNQLVHYEEVLGSEPR